MSDEELVVRVDSPTAIPSAPIINNSGSLDGRLTGSWRRPS